jgi:signal transduction histidine kinase
MSESRLIGVSGLVTWLMVGLPALVYHTQIAASDWRWIVVFLLFGAAFAADQRRARLWWLLAEAALAVALVLLRCSGYEGALLAVVAMQLGARVEPKPGIAWICVQTALLWAANAAVFNTRSAWLLTPPYLGFQLVAFFIFNVMAREVAARAALVAANAELRAVQHILTDSSRMAERLRIAQELHDALGHRLTALSLNLEAALQRTEELAGLPAATAQQRRLAHANVESAQSLARQLLGDVRDIVAQSRARDGVDLAAALHELVGAVPRPRIHLDMAEGLRVADPERAHILLRCAQEIVTNAARHSGADNLWISIKSDGEALTIQAHDDGRGSASAAGGFGIRGMRERVEKAGGQVHIATQPGRGFDVTALLPVRGGVA